MSKTHLLAFALLAVTAQAAELTRLKVDEQIVFYPTIGQRVPGKHAWRLDIQGCVFEPEKGRVSLALLREALELKDAEMTSAETALFNERARLFLVDHERGKWVHVRFGDQVLRIGKSQANGRISGTVTLSEKQVRRLAQTSPGGGLPFEVALPPGDPRRFTGQVLLLDDSGVSVVSDIDDTIKITDVRDRHAMLRNTFLRKFQPVPGMAEFYQTLARSNGAVLHYVSASPWQLYEPLAAFTRSNGFPAGTFALKEFRWKDRSFTRLLVSPEKYKPAVIEPLFKRFPKRRFILMGDSGERDPEIYAALARRFPLQVERIYIRDVTGESEGAERYQETFRGLPTGLWQIFREPREIKIVSN